jgi:hypothetical protein
LKTAENAQIKDSVADNTDRRILIGSPAAPIKSATRYRLLWDSEHDTQRS